MNYEKLVNTVLYLLQACPQRPGIVGLMKLIFFSDYEHYRRHLRPITNAQYVALPNGPVVDEYSGWFDRMVADGFVIQERRPIPGLHDKQEYSALRKPDLDVFNEPELDTLRLVVECYGGMTTTALVQKSHREGPWPLVWCEDEPGRPIPYSLFRWLDNLPTDGDRAAALEDISRPEVAAVIRQLNAEFRPAAATPES